MLFVLFFLAACESPPDAHILYNWDGQTDDTNIYVETSDGKFYFINILTGEVMWSIETGGNVCTSTSIGQTTYVPSIDGFLFTYTPEYGFQRLALSIRELVFTAPFRTRSGEIFSSGKTTSIFFIDPYNGSITNVYVSNITKPPETDPKEDKEHITIIRVDYDLSVFNGDVQLVRYSEFEIFSIPSNSGVIHNVNVETQFAGQLIIKVNNSLQVQVQIPGVVTGVFGSEGKFNYCMLGNDKETSDQSIMLLGDKSLAIPSQPRKPPSIFQRITWHFPALTSGKEEEEDELTEGLHKVKKQYAPYQKITALPKPQEEDGQTAPAIQSILPSNFITIPIILVLLYFALRIVLFLVARLMKVERKLDPIIVDRYDPSKGTSGGRKLTLVHKKTINMKCLMLARSVGLLDNTAKFLKDEIKENETIIGYQQMDAFDFEHLDPVQFLTRMFGALKSIFSVGLVHGSISEEVIFSDSGKATLAGLEWSCLKTFSSEKRAKDIRDTAMVVRRSLNHFNIPFETLLIDLLSEMENDDPLERPTPDEALGHPFFWSLPERTKLYYYVNDELSSQSAPPALIQEFEESRIAVLQCTSWLTTLPKPLINDLKSRGDYGGDSMRDLVRMIRNKCEHFSEIPPKLAEIIGTTSEEVFIYFDQKFPNLFLYTYYFYQKFCC